MLVEVKNPTDYNDLFKEVLLNEPGPFLVSVSSCDLGINTDLIHVRLLAKTEDGYSVSRLHVPVDKKGNHNCKEIAWTYDLANILANYKLLPKGYQVTLIQTV